MTLSAEAVARMRRFLASHPKDRHGAHRYSLSAFGLDARDLRSRFKSYCERFDLSPEAAVPGRARHRARRPMANQ